MQYKFHWAAIALLSAFIQGCPSGSTPLGGVAAVGAPMSDATVVLVDANGTSFSVKSNAEGAYSFDDVSSMTAPFLLKATGVVGGDEETLYSALDEKPSPGGNAVLNATPMTNAVVSQASGGDPAALFANPKALDASAMKQAKADLIAVLADQMKAQGLDPASFDPFKTPFKANSSGADKLLDLVQIKADSTGQINLKEKASGVETTFAKGEQNVAQKIMKPPSDGFKLLDMSKVKSLISGLNEFIASTSAPEAKALSIKNLFDKNFKSNGKDINDFASMLSSDKAKGVRFSGFTFGGCQITSDTNPKDTVCEGTVALLEPSGAIKKESLPVIWDGSKWMFYGNQRQVGVDLTPNIIIDVPVICTTPTNCSPSTPQVTQGFELEIENGSGLYLTGDLIMTVKVGNTPTDYPITTFESNSDCYQLVLPADLRPENDACYRFLTYEKLVELSTLDKEVIKTAYKEGRLTFKLLLTPSPANKNTDTVVIPSFKPDFTSVPDSELAEDKDTNFKKMLVSKFNTRELGSKSVTMPKGVDLEWVSFYLYNGTTDTALGTYFDKYGMRDIKDYPTYMALGPTIDSAEICSATKLITKSICDDSNLITSIRWKFRDPNGSDLRIIFGYYFVPSN